MANYTPTIASTVVDVPVQTSVPQHRPKPAHDNSAVDRSARESEVVTDQVDRERPESADASKGPDFKDVLEKRIGEKDEQKSAGNETETDVDAKSNDKKEAENQPILEQLISPDAELVAKMAIKDSKTPVNLENLKQESGDQQKPKSNELAQKIVEITSNKDGQKDGSSMKNAVLEQVQAKLEQVKQGEGSSDKNAKVKDGEAAPKEAVEPVKTPQKHGMNMQEAVDTQKAIDAPKNADLQDKAGMDKANELVNQAGHAAENAKAQIKSESQDGDQGEINKLEMSEELNLTKDMPAAQKNQAQADTDKPNDANDFQTAKQKAINTLDAEVNTNKAQNEQSVVEVFASKAASEVAIPQDNNPVNTASTVSAVQKANAVNPAEGISGVNVVESTRLSPAEQVVNNIAAANISSPDRVINIHLNPNDLGSVQIRFQQSAGEISGTIEVEKSDTMQDIEKALPQIISSLQDAGVQVKKVEVVMNNQNQQSNQQNAGEDVQRGFDRNNTPREFFTDSSSDSYDRSSASENAAQDGQAAQSTTNISDSGINMYV